MLRTKHIATTTVVVTFALFMTEAIVHYNMGRESVSQKDDKFLPPTPTLIKMALVVGAFSVLNGVVINELAK